MEKKLSKCQPLKVPPPPTQTVLSILISPFMDLNISFSILVDTKTSSLIVVIICKTSGTRKNSVLLGCHTLCHSIRITNFSSFDTILVIMEWDPWTRRMNKILKTREIIASSVVFGFSDTFHCFFDTTVPWLKMCCLACVTFIFMGYRLEWIIKKSS